LLPVKEDQNKVYFILTIGIPLSCSKQYRHFTPSTQIMVNNNNNNNNNNKIMRLFIFNSNKQLSCRCEVLLLLKHS